MYPYDLAMALLSDGYTDGLDDLIGVVNGVTGKDSKEDVISAFNDFNE